MRLATPTQCPGPRADCSRDPARQRKPDACGVAAVLQTAKGRIVDAEKEAVLCAKIADALDARGEESLADQVWEQARRILCVETVDQAKDEIRIRLKADGDR